MISAKDHTLIERFVEGALTGAELKEFQERMTSDASFKAEAEFYNLLLSGIRISREQELEKFITTHVSVRHYTPRSVIAIVIVMLIIIAAGVGVWNYLERDSFNENKNFFTTAFFTDQINKAVNAVSNGRQKQAKRNSAKTNAVAPIDSSIDEEAASQPISDSAAMASAREHSGDTLSEDENIVIKKDELISTVEMVVVNKTQEQGAHGEKPKESLAKETAEKLNPAAQLPVEENAYSNTLQVEFWQSPVNYKGFKLLNNKLVLFGIDRPEAVKLYSLNNQLYMQYGQLVSKLNPTYDYQSFLALKESEIPPQLK